MEVKIGGQLEGTVGLLTNYSRKFTFQRLKQRYCKTSQVKVIVNDRNLSETHDFPTTQIIC